VTPTAHSSKFAGAGASSAQRSSMLSPEMLIASPLIIILNCQMRSTLTNYSYDYYVEFLRNVSRATLTARPSTAVRVRIRMFQTKSTRSRAPPRSSNPAPSSLEHRLPCQRLLSCPVAGPLSINCRYRCPIRSHNTHRSRSTIDLLFLYPSAHRKPRW
jgi:hypothetical protein